MRYSTTIEDLKIKLFGMCKLRPSKTTIHKDGQPLTKEHCTLLYYDISQGSQLDASEVHVKEDDKKNKMRIFVRPSMG